MMTPEPVSTTTSTSRFSSAKKPSSVAKVRFATPELMADGQAKVNFSRGLVCAAAPPAPASSDAATKPPNSCLIVIFMVNLLAVSIRSIWDSRNGSGLRPSSGR